MSGPYTISANKMRQAIYDRMADEWGLKYDLKLVKLLKAIMGREASLDRYAMTDHEIDVCKKLLGPHGYAYFKAFMARQEVDHDSK
jgi:hypothetical protein